MLCSRSPLSFDILTEGQKLDGQKPISTDGGRDKRHENERNALVRSRKHFSAKITIIMDKGKSIAVPQFYFYHMFSNIAPICCFYVFFLRSLNPFVAITREAASHASTLHEDPPLYSLFSLVARHVKYA